MGEKLLYKGVDTPLKTFNESVEHTDADDLVKGIKDDINILESGILLDGGNDGFPSIMDGNFNEILLDFLRYTGIKDGIGNFLDGGKLFTTIAVEEVPYLSMHELWMALDLPEESSRYEEYGETVYRMLIYILNTYTTLFPIPEERPECGSLGECISYIEDKRSLIKLYDTLSGDPGLQDGNVNINIWTIAMKENPNGFMSIIAQLLGTNSNLTNSWSPYCTIIKRLEQYMDMSRLETGFPKILEVSGYLGILYLNTTLNSLVSIIDVSTGSIRAEYFNKHNGSFIIEHEKITSEMRKRLKTPLSKRVIEISSGLHFSHTAQGVIDVLGSAGSLIDLVDLDNRDDIVGSDINGPYTDDQLEEFDNLQEKSDTNDRYDTEQAYALSNMIPNLSADPEVMNPQDKNLWRMTVAYTAELFDDLLFRDAIHLSEENSNLFSQKYEAYLEAQILLEKDEKYRISILAVNRAKALLYAQRNNVSLQPDVFGKSETDDFTYRLIQKGETFYEYDTRNSTDGRSRVIMSQEQIRYAQEIVESHQARIEEIEKKLLFEPTKSLGSFLEENTEIFAVISEHNLIEKSLLNGGTLPETGTVNVLGIDLTSIDDSERGMLTRKFSLDYIHSLKDVFPVAPSRQEYLEFLNTIFPDAEEFTNNLMTGWPRVLSPLSLITSSPSALNEGRIDAEVRINFDLYPEESAVERHHDSVGGLVHAFKNGGIEFGKQVTSVLIGIALSRLKFLKGANIFAKGMMFYGGQKAGYIGMDRALGAVGDSFDTDISGSSTWGESVDKGLGVYQTDSYGKVLLDENGNPLKKTGTRIFVENMHHYLMGTLLLSSVWNGKPKLGPKGKPILENGKPVIEGGVAQYFTPEKLTGVRLAREKQAVGLGLEAGVFTFGNMIAAHPLQEGIIAAIEQDLDLGAALSAYGNTLGHITDPSKIQQQFIGNAMFIGAIKTGNAGMDYAGDYFQGKRVSKLQRSSLKEYTTLNGELNRAMEAQGVTTKVSKGQVEYIKDGKSIDLSAELPGVYAILARVVKLQQKILAVEKRKLLQAEQSGRVEMQKLIEKHNLRDTGDVILSPRDVLAQRLVEAKKSGDSEKIQEVESLIMEFSALRRYTRVQTRMKTIRSERLKGENVIKERIPKSIDEVLARSVLERPDREAQMREDYKLAGNEFNPNLTKARLDELFDAHMQGQLFEGGFANRKSAELVDKRVKQGIISRQEADMFQDMGYLSLLPERTGMIGDIGNWYFKDGIGSFAIKFFVSRFLLRQGFKMIDKKTTDLYKKAINSIKGKLGFEVTETNGKSLTDWINEVSRFRSHSDHIRRLIEALSIEKVKLETERDELVEGVDGYKTELASKKAELKLKTDKLAELKSDGELLGKRAKQEVEIIKPIQNRINAIDFQLKAMNTKKEGETFIIDAVNDALAGVKLAPSRGKVLPSLKTKHSRIRQLVQKINQIKFDIRGGETNESAGNSEISTLKSELNAIKEGILTERQNTIQEIERLSQQQSVLGVEMRAIQLNSKTQAVGEETTKTIARIEGEVNALKADIEILKTKIDSGGVIKDPDAHKALEAQIQQKETEIQEWTQKNDRARYKKAIDRIGRKTWITDQFVPGTKYGRDVQIADGLLTRVQEMPAKYRESRERTQEVEVTRADGTVEVEIIQTGIVRSVYEMAKYPLRNENGWKTMGIAMRDAFAMTLAQYGLKQGANLIDGDFEDGVTDGLDALEYVNPNLWRTYAMSYLPAMARMIGTIYDGVSKDNWTGRDELDDGGDASPLTQAGFAGEVLIDGYTDIPVIGGGIFEWINSTLGIEVELTNNETLQEGNKMPIVFMVSLLKNRNYAMQQEHPDFPIITNEQRKQIEEDILMLEPGEIPLVVPPTPIDTTPKVVTPIPVQKPASSTPIPTTPIPPKPVEKVEKKKPTKIQDLFDKGG